MMGQVIRPIRCMSSASGAFEYPGNTSQAIWSIVMARIASSLIWFASMVFFIALSVLKHPDLSARVLLFFFIALS